ncbi:MAG TPA: rhomboid family intramembrane serine protease [Bacteroidales bacterium]|nr:rhomboid family intramembrane serine protease [Bacteroidales bacterium]HRZ76680.1 rhomboid family intramembrane serine protease [Bacteroidales bacterium]
MIFDPRTALVRLALINIGVFVAVGLVNLMLWLFQVNAGDERSYGSLVLPWLAVPAGLSQLAARPWTLFSYMFFHEGFLHLLFNLIVLFFGGRLFVAFLDGRKLAFTYILGGLSGAVFFILAYNLFPVFAPALPFALALGASASVLAIMVAAASYRPNQEVVLFLFGRVKLKYIALALVIIDILSIQQGNPGGHIAHLGGAFWGFIAALWLRYHPLQRVFVRKRGPRPTSGRGYRRDWKEYRTMSQPGERPLNDEEYNLRRQRKQQRMDEILDKISRQGYENLSQEEKDFLFRSGKDH